MDHGCQISCQEREAFGHYWIGLTGGMACLKGEHPSVSGKRGLVGKMLEKTRERSNSTNLQKFTPHCSAYE